MTRRLTFVILATLVFGVSMFVGRDMYAKYSRQATTKMIDLERYKEADGTYNFRRDYDSKQYSYLSADIREMLKAEDLRLPKQIKREIKEAAWHANLQIVFAGLTGIACSWALFLLLFRRGRIVSPVVDSIFTLALIPFWPLYNARYDCRREWIDFSGMIMGGYVLVYITFAMITVGVRTLRRQPKAL